MTLFSVSMPQSLVIRTAPLPDGLAICHRRQAARRKRSCFMGDSEMKATLRLFVSLAAGLVLAAHAWALPFSALYAFGDSLSDAGANPSAVMSI